MTKTPVESTDSGADQRPATDRDRPPANQAKARANGFDVDSWEPSLLERMLKADGRKPRNE